MSLIWTLYWKSFFYSISASLPLMRSNKAAGIPLSPSKALVTYLITLLKASFSSSISKAVFSKIIYSISLLGSTVSLILVRIYFAKSSELLDNNFLGLISFLLNWLVPDFFFFFRDLELEVLDLGEIEYYYG